MSAFSFIAQPLHDPQRFGPMQIASCESTDLTIVSEWLNSELTTTTKRVVAITPPACASATEGEPSDMFVARELWYASALYQTRLLPNGDGGEDAEGGEV